MQNVKEALEYAICVFDTLHNTQTYHGDNQDFSDEIITMRAALAELEQSVAVEPGMLNTCLSNAKQEPAQAVPVAWLRPDKCHVDFHKHPGYLPLYTAPPAIDDDTKRMVLELCDIVENYTDIPLTKQIREMLGEA